MSESQGIPTTRVVLAQGELDLLVNRALDEQISLIEKRKLRGRLEHIPVHQCNFFCYRVSEDLLDDVLADVATEFQSVCDDFAEGVYLDEFAVKRKS